MGDTLDGLLPFPQSWKEKVKQWVKPSIDYYDSRCWDYREVFKRFRAGKVITLRDYLQKTIINMRVESTLRRFYEGRIFAGAARFVLLGITCYDVGKYAYRAYQHPKDRKKNIRKCLLQAIKWTIGTEVGNIGFDIGVTLAHTRKDKLVTGFLMDALLSASFDKIIQNYFKVDN